MPQKELQTLFISINGTKFEPLTDCNSLEQIEVSDIDEYIPHKLDVNSRFEISFDMDEQAAQKLHTTLQPKHGKKLTVETSCVCDGTLVFAIQLIQRLRKLGAVNIKLRNEEVENPNPTWMRTKFIATGIMWNTNNYRRLHGIPMKRRRK